MDFEARTAEERREIGLRLKGARSALRITQGAVAEMLAREGFKTAGKATIGHWETGRNLPDILILRRLAKLYHTSLDLLAWGDALSMESMRFAAEYESLTDEQKRTLRAIWVAFIQQGNGAEGIAPAPAVEPKKAVA